MTNSFACAEEESFIRKVISGEYGMPSGQGRTIVVDDVFSFCLSANWVNGADGISENMISQGAFDAYMSTDDAGCQAAVILMREAAGDRSIEDMGKVLGKRYGSCTSKTSYSTNTVWAAGGSDRQIERVYFANNGMMYTVVVDTRDARSANSEQLIWDLNIVTESLYGIKPAEVYDSEALVKEAISKGEAPAVFQSASFEAMVRGALNKADDQPVYPTELAAIRNLHINPCGGYLERWMYDLTNRERNSRAGEYKYTEYTEMSLRDIALLTGLRLLNVNDVQMTEMESVLPMAELTSLSLTGCSLQSCDVFAQMHQLTTLGLARNNPTSLEPLAGLVQLQDLNIFSDQVESIEPLLGLTELTYLHIGSNPIKDLPDLSGFTKLATLVLSRTNIASLEALSGLTALETLTIAQIPDATLSLKPLAGLEHLSSIDAYGTDISDQDALSERVEIR